MTTEAAQSVVKTFHFSFPTCTNEEILFKLEVPVDIPYGGSTRELVQRVINMFHVPVYLENELNEKLAAFVAEETKNFHNERDAKLLDQLKNSEFNVDGIVKGWEKIFKDNVVEFAEQKGTSDEEVFAAAYHKLVHSAALDTILQVESEYARTVMSTLKNRDEDIRKLTERQTEEMEEKIRLLNTSSTEQEINALAAEQFEQQALVDGRWGSQLDALGHAQRAQHRAWLMATLDHYQSTAALHTPSNSPLGSWGAGAATAMGAATGAMGAVGAPRPRLEDSFTIHLGSQLKQTHNIRIAAMDLLDLCTLNDDIDNPSERSRRLQTSLGLYGSELSAVVLLSETPPGRGGGAGGGGAGPTRRLLAAAARSTEHHFDAADAQLRDIAERVKEPVEKRNSQLIKEQSEGASGAGWHARARARRSTLQSGDVFVTKHSNLADVHVVFHLMVDDSLKSGDITSRHPAILGLRNILKAACSNDVTSIALPLLLRHEHSEEMTAAWCVRRAELVLKCVKGFMLEAAGGGGADLTTLTFAAPPDTAPPLFATLAALTPNIFRLSNPVKFKPRPQDDTQGYDLDTTV